MQQVWLTNIMNSPSPDNQTLKLMLHQYSFSSLILSAVSWLRGLLVRELWGGFGGCHGHIRSVVTSWKSWTIRNSEYNGIELHKFSRAPATLPIHAATAPTDLGGIGYVYTENMEVVGATSCSLIAPLHIRTHVWTATLLFPVFLVFSLELHAHMHMQRNLCHV